MARAVLISARSLRLTTLRSQGFRSHCVLRGPSHALRRHASTFPGTGGGSNLSKPLWRRAHALLFATFVSTIAYVYGVTDAGENVDKLWVRHSQPRYGKTKDLEKAIKELQGLLGEDAISIDDEDLREHGYSEWSTVNIDALPIAVAYPRNTEEVSQIAKVCTKYRVPMVPFSGGSSLEANFAAPFGGICIDFAFMDHIIAVHDKDMDVVLQPAVQWMELNEKIKHTGLFFPVDPGPSAKIGGMVGTSCSGTNAFRYGTMRDWVVNLTVVLSDGRIIKTRRRPRKTAAGYNLTGLFIGAEGTLGIVTEITLKLAVIPQETRVGVATFPTIRDAASTAMQIIRAGVPVAAMELLDEVQMNVINRAGAVSRRYAEVPTLFFKFSGTTAGVQDNIRISRKIATANNAEDLIFAKNEEEGKALWTARKEALWSMMSLREPGSEVWSTDVAVPISRLPEIIEISKKEMDELGLFASILGHIGDGNFHESIMYQPHEKAAVEHVVHRMVNRALEMEGTVTGEHGIGLGKKQGLVKELGPETIAVMQTIKKSLDPYWLLNPGKIFDYGDVTLTKDISEATAASTLDHPQR